MADEPTKKISGTYEDDPDGARLRTEWLKHLPTDSPIQGEVVWEMAWQVNHPEGPQAVLREANQLFDSLTRSLSRRPTVEEEATQQERTKALAASLAKMKFTLVESAPPKKRKPTKPWKKKRKVKPH